MARQIAWVLALVLTCAASEGVAQESTARRDRGTASGGDAGNKAQPSSVSPADRERWKWWLYDRAELGITDQQSQAINEIWESTIPKLRESRAELDRAEGELSRTIKEHKADLATISLLVDRVESARSQNNKMRVLMLYRVHLLLTPEQRTKLEALRARQDRERRDRDKDRRKP